VTEKRFGLMPVSYPSIAGDVEQKLVRIEAEDGFVSKGVLYRRPDSNPDIVFHTMHPKSDQSQFYLIPYLVDAGFAVFGEVSRYINNDTALIHEEVLLDIAASIRLLEGLGYSIFIPLAMSGGGPLYTMYQSQALKSPQDRFQHTPGGDPPDFSEVDMRTVDAIVYIGAHLGPGKFLLKRIDPSVVDEHEPFATDPELDMYNPANGFVPPPEPSRYSDEFLSRYRGAQEARVHRIDSRARALIEEQRYRRDRVGEESFTTLPADLQIRMRQRMVFEPFLVIWRTDADPAFLDLRISPSDRLVGSLLSPSAMSPNSVDLNPHITNYSTWGFGRLHTPRGWLSTWSGLSSQTATLDNIVNVDTPQIFMYYTADTAIYPAEGQAAFEASPAHDKEFHLMEGADHYGLPSGPKAGDGRQREKVAEMTVAWTRKRFT
jgi:hypothetical protein